ncbi:hypothetical protein PPERSA_05650 [Pseudocohnilembus persalinus]|uniref:Uncharacterized protein n=1 Tax=Pseudocohnilembus persalinus TaxID=266149 RepID=A0A0V0QQZ9_PSEPJ|nr:hypothetical protein PPERSA_05650 [Pseudocohnilembus persalinus]|eukprot:KRX04389.1 hypothetical protein PPERSA_05650 [Pseudocohnilembus persalinus]
MTVDTHSENFINQHKKKLEDTEQVNSQDPVKMNVFFEFLFDIDLVIELVKPKWIEVYDENYIDNDIIGKLEERLPKIAELLSSLSQKATGKKSDLVNTLESTLDVEVKQTIKQPEKKQPTEQKPFNLTKPKPKMLPEPILIPKKLEKKVVNIDYNKTSLEEIQRQKQMRKKQIEEQTKSKYQEEEEFKLKTKERPSNYEKLVKEHEEKFKKEHQYVQTYHRPVPDFSEPSDVKLNVAAILREEKKLKEQEEKERKRLNDLEWNLRDSTEFENWKIEKKHEDKIKELEQQQRTKIEMALAREAAMMAYEQNIKENQLTVQEMKAQSEKFANEIAEKKKEEIVRKNQIKESVMATKDNATIKRQEIVEKNKKAHDEYLEEREKVLILMKQEQEKEKAKRDELIRQIKELERQPRKRTSGYDPTETMGYGLLEEMSMVQLRERLEEVKEQRALKEEEIRQQNRNNRDNYLSSIQKKVDAIQENRKNLAQKKNEERLEKKRKQEEEKKRLQEIKEKQLLEVHQKIKGKKTQKKMEEEQLAKDLREIKLKRQYMNASAALVEEQAWQNLQQGAEREIREKQVNALIDQERIESIKYKERKILAETAKRTVKQKQEWNNEYDKKYEKAQKENEILFRQIRDDKRALVTSIKEFEQAHNQNMVERDTFKYKMSEMSLTNAKKTQELKKSRETRLKQSQGNQNYNGNQQQQQQQNDMELPGAKYGLPSVQEEQ